MQQIRRTVEAMENAAESARQNDDEGGSDALAKEREKLKSTALSPALWDECELGRM